MKTTVSEPQSWKRVVNVEIPEQDVQKAFDEKLKNYRYKVKLPGFRPGRVPENLIKQRFGKSIRAEIIEDFIKDSYIKACKEYSINPIADPKVVDLKAEEGNPLVFSIETEVDPKIEITGYRNLKIKQNPRKIKESDVDDTIQRIREQFATFTDVDRPVENGDFVRIEYLKVVIDGEERKDIASPKYPLEVGGEKGLKDFYKGIIGRKAGDTVEIDIKFPKDYSEANIAGKRGVFTVKLLRVQEKSLPEINEEFLKKIGDFADENALRERIYHDLEEEERKRAREEAVSAAVDQLIKENEFEVPPSRIEQVINYMYNESLKYRRPEQAVPSREEFAQRYRDSAIYSIKRQMIIDAIAEKENIKAIQKEVDVEIARMAEIYKQDFEKLKQVLRKNGTTLRIRDQIRERKTLDFLLGEYDPANDSAEN